MTWDELRKWAQEQDRIRKGPHNADSWEWESDADGNSWLVSL